MNEQTLSQLRALKLPSFIQGLAEQQQSKHYLDLTFEERLGMLVEREYHRRNNQRMLQRLRKAQLKQSATIEQIDFTVPRGLSKKVILELSALHWLAKHHNIIIVGPTGVGKSFLASAIAHHACIMGYSARYTKMSQILGDLRLAKADGSFSKFSAELAKVNLLIIDEWLREPLTEDLARELLDLLDDRFRKAACIFASQPPPADWYRLIKDPTLAEAILDRVVHDSIRIELTGGSMRKITSQVQLVGKNTSLRSDNS